MTLVSGGLERREIIPPIFISHGAPASALDSASATELGQWGRELPRPRGVLVVSAHWQAGTLSRGSTAARPKLLHDFDGYASTSDGHAALERTAYAAPGAAELAYELAALVPVERTERAWDHGVWSPLLRMFPEADIPVLQLSLVMGAVPRRLFGIGRKIGALAARGYLIVGSGGITHNLAELDPRKDAPPADWAREFDAWVANLLADAEMDELLAWRANGPGARRAHPTSEHLDPLFVVAGAASLYEHAVGFPIRGFEHGTLSRRCVQFGR
ncbi:MAG: extradiol ring-cleavage dioxygenase [Labilithrix sp.]|nr:extradiol ring-cleavage dioxygenase [Labilithrix sp.]